MKKSLILSMGALALLASCSSEESVKAPATGAI